MTTPQTLREEIKQNFPAGLTLRQLWIPVKIAKYVRLRARNNTAFNNLFNVLFSGEATFRTVDKQRKDGTTYPGLSITTASGETDSQDEENS